MNLKYKLCALDDLELLTNILRDTFINAFEKDNNPEDFKTYMEAAFNKSQIKTELLNSNSQFYLVFLENDPVGYFKINVNEAQAEPFGKNPLELSRIYVLKRFQGQKLGSRILQEIISLTKSLK